MNRRVLPFFLRAARALVALAASAGLAAACGGNVVVDSPECDAGLTACGNECVDTDTDPQNCGACGVSCGGGACSGGDCLAAPTCPLDTVACAGKCVDTDTDPQNCGDCGVVCPIGATCAGGFCDVPSGCLCGTICGYTDLGSSVPNQITTLATGMVDSFALDCGAGGGEEVFLFTAPYGGLFAFDTFGSAADTTLQILSTSCQSLGCNDDFMADGTSGMVLSLLAGQQVIVLVEVPPVVDGTKITLHVSSPTDCVGCSELITEPSPSGALCPQSEVYYNELVECICAGPCQNVCQGLCNGQEPNAACQSCILDERNGCGKEFQACANDI